jgi:diguanylate cyclase (GGDEF)-like protein
MRVVELTGNDAVRVKDLADAIQNDQALAAKILKTVNSSLYAVRTRCSSINQAIVMLGMTAVKSLALSFTLVGAIRECQPGDFDMDDYWRRGIFTAIAARAIAAKAHLRSDPTPEECFLGGLLQDLGMLALYLTLGVPYLEVIDAAEGDHRKVTRIELKVLEVHHADVGAMLAKRWKLPETLVMPIKYHERPTAAPLEHTAVVRAVGLGNIAADVMMAQEPTAALRRFYDRAKAWFNFDTAQADEVLETISDSAREVRSLLNVPPSEIPDTSALIAEAKSRMQNLGVHGGEHGSQASPTGDTQTVDELTGVASRLQFDRALVAAFEQTRSCGGPLSAAIFDVSALEEINQRYGREAGDTVLIGVAGRLERAVEAMGGLVARYDDGRFATIMPRTDRETAIRTSETARESVSGEPFRLVAAKAGAPPTVKAFVTVGVATVDDVMIQRFENPGDLMNLVEQTAKTAKKTGGNAMRVYAPAA